MSLAIKGGAGVSRTEVELPLTREQYQALWPLTRGRRVSKTRFALPHPSGTLELDVYDGPLRGLMTVEIEFATRRDSRAFQPPDWFGPEITHHATFKNQNLALSTGAGLLVSGSATPASFAGSLRLPHAKTRRRMTGANPVGARKTAAFAAIFVGSGSRQLDKVVGPRRPKLADTPPRARLNAPRLIAQVGSGRTSPRRRRAV